MTAFVLDQLTCAVCELEVDLEWSVRTGRTTHAHHDAPPAPEPAPSGTMDGLEEMAGDALSWADLARLGISRRDH